VRAIATAWRWPPDICEAELRQQFHASDKIVAKAPPGVIIVPLDQPAYATGQGKQRVIGQIGFRRFAILERH
jgi:hypothetical protein